jgi:eukaryotic-like serine/threonine-protein kinase
MGLDADGLALVTRELALYVGPIARVLVNRSAPHCANLHELYLRVADEIESDEARAKFLAKRRRSR